MTIMTVYVTETLRLDVMWAGIALGVAAALEVPALLLIGRLSNRFSHLGLIATSCLAGIGYYLGLAFATGPIMLVGLQLLNTWSFAGIAGIGLPLFQHMIPRPGLSTGLYMNTRRIGSIVSGPSSRSAPSPCSANAASSLPAPFSPSSAWPSSPLPAEHPGHHLGTEPKTRRSKGTIRFDRS